MNDNIQKQFNIFSNICLNKVDSFRKLKLPDIPLLSNNQAVYIEFRQLPHSEVIIRNCIYHLGDKWSHVIITSSQNRSYYENMAKYINNNIQVIGITTEETHNSYNNLLLTKDFWNMLSGEKILIYQSDSFIFKNSISQFLEWDYIGSPFPTNVLCCNHQVGNGGLSLRSKSKMIEILNKINLNENIYSKHVNMYKNIKKLDNFPEDIVFSQNMQNMKIGKVSDYKTAKCFSIDLGYNHDSFGMHCMWNCNKNWVSILNKKIDTILI